MDLKNMINTKKISELTGLDPTTIRHFANEIPGAINPSGTGWLYPLSAVDWIKNRPETRGRKKNEL